jgi:phosphonate transport system substrate-binding protein
VGTVPLINSVTAKVVLAAAHACCASALSVLAPRAHAGPPTYTLAVVPAQLPLTAYREWSPLAEQIGAHLGARIELKVYPTFPQFEAELRRGVADLVFLNPYQQVMARKAQGYLPLVRSSETLIGVLVVRSDSPVRNVRDLEGKTLGFPSASAFGASLYLRALLSEHERIRFTPRYLESHTEVYRHVLLGEVAAGGGIYHTLEREPADLRRRLRVIYETPPSVSHALAAHPRLPEAARAKVRDFLLGLGRSPDGKALLASLQLAEPVAADYTRDYAPLERLGLEKYLHDKSR